MSKTVKIVCALLLACLLSSCASVAVQSQTTVATNTMPSTDNNASPAIDLTDGPSATSVADLSLSPSPLPTLGSDPAATIEPTPKPTPRPSNVPAGIVKNSGQIIGTDVALRAQPDANSALIARLNQGVYVQILQTNVNAQWHQVVYNGKTGYVNRMYICLDSSLDGYKLDYVATIVNCKEDVNVRSGPSASSQLVGVAKKGDSLAIVPQDTLTDGWYQVQFEGKTAYIHANYLDIEAKADNTQLTSLFVSGGSLYPSFTPKEYGYVIKTDKSKVTITARANSGVNVNVGESGTNSITVDIPSAGMQTVRIALDGKIRYSLYISRNVLTVGTWNIKRGNDSLLTQGRLVYDQQPDIMGIQEAYENLKASNIVDNLASLKTRTMLYSAFAPTIGYSNGSSFGIGLISRYKFASIETFPLDSGSYEKRVLQKTVVSIGGKKVSLYNTHFTFNTASIRARQFAQVLEIMNKDTNKYKILTGDFNADYKEFSVFQGYTVVNSPDRKYYDNAMNEIKYNEIDNIIVSGNIKVINSLTIVTSSSDHAPVFAYLILS